MDERDEIEELLQQNPSASAGYAHREMHYGRLEWLAEHIRRCDFSINPVVARKILSMLERSEANCLFELVAVRRSDIHPATKDPVLLRHRDASMAVDVARHGGFKRGHLDRACYEVGKLYGLKPASVRKRVKEHRERALETLADEQTEAAYLHGEVDFLGRPKGP